MAMSALREHRMTLLFGAALYVAWGALSRIALPDAVDPMQERLLLAGLLVGAAEAARRIREIRSKSWLLLEGAVWLTTLHLFTLAWRNDLILPYAMSLYMGVFVFSAFMTRLFSRRAYVLYVCLLTLGMLARPTPLPRIVFIASVATALLAAHATHRNRLALLLKLHQSRENSRRLENEKDRALRRANTLYNVLSTLGEPAPFPEVLQVVLQTVARNLRWRSGAYYQVNGSDRMPERIAGFPTLDRWASIPDECVQASSQDRIVSRFRSGIWVPVRQTGSIAGVLELRDANPDTDLDESQSLLISIAWQLSEHLDRVRSAETLAQQQLQIIHASKMSALGEMAGGVAHEINNPLAIIHGRAGQLVELAHRGSIDPAFVIQAAEKIEHTVRRISNIVRGLRSFAREGDNDPFVLTPLRSIVDDTLSFCRERFKHHAVEIRVKHPGEDITLECQESRISQILLNLLNNAFDAVQNQTERWIEIESRRTGEVAELAVTDSGNGIPPAQRDRIFNPFFTTKEVGKGTGLGLSISQGIAEAHRGLIRLDTRSDRTRFIVVLPLRQGEASRSRTALDAPPVG